MAGNGSYSVTYRFQVEQDIRDKKRTGTGVYSKTGKKGYVGKMRTPYDLMSTQEKRQLNNEVVIYSMYDNIMPYDDFKLLDEAERARTLAEYLKRFSRKKISEFWGVKTYTINNWVSQLGLSQPKQTQKTNTHQKEDEVPVERNEGFSVKLIGSYNGKEIQDRLMALAQILIHDRPYNITFVINEEDNK